VHQVVSRYYKRAFHTLGLIGTSSLPWPVLIALFGGVAFVLLVAQTYLGSSHRFDSAALVNTCISLGVAFILGNLIGLERQLRQRTAGLRTNTLVAVGAAVFVDMAGRLNGHEGAVHVAAYVVSGIGFLGAGAIMKEGANISGLNTAATLWGSAAVGACAGAGLIVEATLASLFVLASNTLLRPVVNRINRKPIDEASSEAAYTVYVICSRKDQAKIREQLTDALEHANYPVRNIDQHAFGQTDAEIEATLFATAVVPEELEAVISKLQALPGVLQAFWNSSIDE
jgi:putative Mg2+ transporter-C (MgtC) family protein